MITASIDNMLDGYQDQISAPRLPSVMIMLARGQKHTQVLPRSSLLFVKRNDWLMKIFVRDIPLWTADMMNKKHTN